MVAHQIMIPRMFTIFQFPVNSPAERSRTTAVDYSKKSVSELKRLLEDKGIAYESGALKADLIRLLKGSE